MNQEHLLRTIQSIRDCNFAELFQLVREIYGDEAACLSLTTICKDDEQVYATIRKALVGRHETENLLSAYWEKQRILESKSKLREFFFFISLDGDDTYQIGVHVSIDEGVADVWFNDLFVDKRYLTPEACIPWGRLAPEDEAMWSLLVSKVERIPNDWYIEAAKDCNMMLLVPFDCID